MLNINNTWWSRACTLLLGICFGAVLNASAQSGHRATLSGCIDPQATNYNFYRVGVLLNTSPLPSCDYVDSTVKDGTTYTYTARGVDATGTESADSNVVTAVIPATVPPPPTGPQVGNRIKVIATANIRATAVNNGFGTLYTTEPTGALGTVTATSTAMIPGVTATWIQVKFDSCSVLIPNCTGWMGSDNMTIVTTPPPPPPPTLKVSCTGLVCTVIETNNPTGTQFPVSVTGPGGQSAGAVAVAP